MSIEMWAILIGTAMFGIIIGMVLGGTISARLPLHVVDEAEALLKGSAR